MVMCAACGAKNVHLKTPDEIAKASYLQGMEELADGNYTEAILIFQKVRRSPGYLRYVALSQLRIGDALFLQEKTCLWSVTMLVFSV